MNKAFHFDYFSFFLRRTETAAIRQESTFIHQGVENSIVFITYLNESSKNKNVMTRLLRMSHPVIVVALCLTWNGDQIPWSKTEEANCINLSPGQKGFIQLAKEDEPGEPLVIHGKVIDQKANRPIGDVSLFLYQTDSSGIYNASGGPDDQARIRGTLHTNESGCFKIKTILPGDYPGRKNSRHLHYVVNAKGYKEIKSILFFKGFTTANITGQGPLSVLDIKREKNGGWVGSIDINMERTDSSSR